MNDKDNEMLDLMKFIQIDEIITYTENQILLEEYEKKSGIKKKKDENKNFYERIKNLDKEMLSL